MGVRTWIEGWPVYRQLTGMDPLDDGVGGDGAFFLPLDEPEVWKSPDIPGYLFLGGLAGGSSLLAAGADMTGRPALSRAAKTGAFAAGALSVVALVHDLGRPARFLSMLRVFTVTSPMSVGSWLLAGYLPACAVAAACSVTGRMRGAGAAATAAAAALGPCVAAYTAALICDTAVPAWHEGYREMPFVCTGSGAIAAGGLGLLLAPPGETVPARNLALAGAAIEREAFERMLHRAGPLAEPYSQGRGGTYLTAGKALAIAGMAGAVFFRRNRIAAAVSGAALMAGSAATRWGIYHAGMASARDPKYTIVPQRERLSQRTGPQRSWTRVRRQQAG